MKWNSDEEFPDIIYAQKTLEVSAEVANRGAFAWEVSRKMFAPVPGILSSPMKGDLFTHPLTTRVIEVAKDGKMAKEVWIALGYETGNDPETNKLMACFVYIMEALLII